MNSKVVVVGVGSVGSATAYAIAIGGLCNELALVDVNAEKAEGEAMDINHAMPLLGGMKVYSAGYEACAGADVIIMTAGVGRKPGETRLDLAAKNAAICKEITENIMKYYNGGVILIATNPVDVITSLVTKWTGLPKGKVVGSGTTLDNTRLAHEISKYLNIDVRSVHGYILGEHGDSQFISWDLSNISGVDVATYFKATGQKFDDEVKEKIAADTKTGGGAVIKRKGFTNLGIAACLADVTQSILGNSNRIHTVSTMLEGLYGIDGVALSILSIVGKGGVVRQLECPLSDEEQAK
ncbi:MAG: L-lactate dehydrogenase, partial [Clostridiales bacterium]|nr:L-lactate dehydrogenase [Clostridiales bacterium]